MAKRKHPPVQTISERVDELLADAPPLTDEQAYAAARILATVPGNNPRLPQAKAS